MVVAVRAGRGLFVRGHRDQRRLPAAVLQAEHDAGQLPRLVPQAERRPDEPGVPVDAGHQLRVRGGPLMRQIHHWAAARLKSGRRRSEEFKRR